MSYGKTSPTGRQLRGFQLAFLSRYGRAKAGGTVTSNILHCLKHGSRLGWLVDPDERAVLVYPPGKQTEIFSAEQEILPVPDLVRDLQLSVGQIFGWLKL
jgi:Putative restriction endonuclease